MRNPAQRGAGRHSDGRAALSEDEYVELGAAVHAERGDCPSGAAGMAQWLGVSYRRRSAAELDVVTECFDQPDRVPQRSLVLAATYRSGSTVLADALISAGGYGWPLEYFQAGAAQRRFARFAAPDYAAEVLRRRTDDNGVFGVKLFPADLRSRPGLWSRLPAPVVVRVRRRDRVGQAVSAWRALNGGAWRATAGEAASPPPEYDYESLRRLVGLFAWEDTWWDSAQGEVVSTVWFEDLAADHAAAMRRLLADLSLAGVPPRGTPELPRLVRQADADSGALVQRFIADYRRRKRQ